MKSQLNNMINLKKTQQKDIRLKISNDLIIFSRVKCWCNPTIATAVYHGLSNPNSSEVAEKEESFLLVVIVNLIFDRPSLYRLSYLIFTARNV